MKTRWRQVTQALAWLVAVFVVGVSPVASATGQSSSSNYSVDQVFFGAGGDLNDCSAIYCAKLSAGEIAAGNAAGTAFQTQAGFNVNREPYLAFSVVAASTDLGTLSTVGTATANATFSAKTYLAGGYVIQVASDPPTNIGGSHHQLNTPSSPVSSAVGTEQFGMNLVANTTTCGAPANFGAPAVQVPDNTFSFGTVTSNYNTCGLFMYAKGAIVAQSTKSTGQTDYTASFIYNISSLTPDGQYKYDGILVATSTF